ncbi:hypothetical protein MCAG_03209 [Micromonospora sp. ATCC 39149]|nr:hypothetical protein MCAG_03209 [Micromonospora sp. ATCC 39149]
MRLNLKEKQPVQQGAASPVSVQTGTPHPTDRDLTVTERMRAGMPETEGGGPRGPPPSEG